MGKSNKNFELPLEVSSDKGASIVACKETVIKRAYPLSGISHFIAALPSKVLGSKYLPLRRNLGESYSDKYWGQS